MAWLLEHLPAREEWTRRFDTKEHATAFLLKRVCIDCLKGLDPTSTGDLLKTSCGTEFRLREGR